MLIKHLMDFRSDPPYTIHDEIFKKYLKKHRDHQIKIHQVALQSNIGRILGPCGTGKSISQIGILIADMLEKNMCGQFGKYLIASHRLKLNLQLIDPLIRLAIEIGLPFNFLFVGSGRYNFDHYYKDYYKNGFTPKVSENLTSLNETAIKNFVAKTQKQNRHLIIVSTYNSIGLLSDINGIDVCTCDEAHNIVANNFTTNIKKISQSIKKLYFFTATQKIDGEDAGMNDESLYGPVLYDGSPAEMLERGEIIQPRIHIIENKDNKETNINDKNMLVKHITEAFTKHSDFITYPPSVKDNTKRTIPTNIGAKLLVAFNGIAEMLRIYNDPIFKQYCIDNNIKAYAISSDGEYSNWISSNRTLDDLNDLADEDKAFLFNVDMLTQGIDLPAITGVMPMRNLGLIKLIQLLGRALRLYSKDRQRLYSGELKPLDFDNYEKPYGWLIISHDLATLDHYEEMEKYVEELMEIYKTPAEQLIIQDKYVDPKNEELNSIIEMDLNSLKDNDLEHSIKDIISKIIIKQIENKFNTAKTDEELKNIIISILN